MLSRRSPIQRAIARIDMQERHKTAADDSSVDGLLAALSSAEYTPDVSVDSEWAAMHIGVCTKTLRKYRKMGVIRSFSVPSGPIRKHSWRYLLSDLDEFIRNHRNLKRYWDPEADEELPVPIVARFLNVTAGTVHALRY